MRDLISRQAAIDAIHQGFYEFFDIYEDEARITPGEMLLFNINKTITARIKALQSVQPETCQGCKHVDKVKYKYIAPCSCCKRTVKDYYTQ